LAGASPIASILDRAVSLGLASLAITDENNLYGAYSFFEASRSRGIRPILGVTLRAPGQASRGGRGVTLLVQNDTGYGNLCSLISRRNLCEDFSIRDVLPKLQEGLFVLTRDPDLVPILRDRLDAGRLFLELVRPGETLERERWIWEQGRRLGLGWVASSDSYFACPGEEERLRILWAIGERSLVSRVREPKFLMAQRYLRGEQEMERLYADCPGSLTNTVRLADECRFDLLQRPVVFPEMAENSREAFSRLREEAYLGAKARYGAMNHGVRDRLEYELGIIEQKGFSGYFLVVSDIARYAKKLGAPHTGRGSGASSVVSYCLGITQVDPIRYDLPFERFLHAQRQDFPDLDLDFCWRVRDRIIRYVYEKHGENHVAMVCAILSFRSRSAFREVARVHGVSDELISRIQDKVSRGLSVERRNTLPVEPETIHRILSLARSIQGFPRHVSVHCGGVVITPGPMERYAPLQRAEKGVRIVQYDKDAVEGVGLVKLDLLGNRSLSTLAEATRWARIQVDPGSVPNRDSATICLLREGRTLGCNQLESPSMRSLLKMLQPKDVMDVMQALALIRPGAASLGMKDAFVRRTRGLEEREIDPCMERALGRTHGIMLYEDDALLVVSRLTGLSLEKADRFRREVKRCQNDEERLRLSKEFLRLCDEKKRDRALCEELWIQMAKFNSYSFCRAHAASYAVLAFALAFLKANHPHAFWVSALNNNAGIYEKWVYAEEMKRTGIRLLAPCVCRSDLECSLEGQAVRIGLLSLAGLSEKTTERIVEQRRERPFLDLWDFLSRVQARRDEVENLIRVGAFDFTTRSRPALLWSLYLEYEQARKRRGDALFRNKGSCVPPPCVPDFSEREKARDEWRLLGMSTTRHPLEWNWGAMRREGIRRSSEMPFFLRKRVLLAGIVAARKSTTTLKGDPMGFVSLDDLDGLFEVTLFPGEYPDLGRIFTDRGPYLVEGQVGDQYGALSVTAHRVRRWNPTTFLRPDRQCHYNHGNPCIVLV